MLRLHVITRIRGRRKFSPPLLHTRVCTLKGREEGGRRKEEGGKFYSPLVCSCVKGRRRVFLSFTSPHARTRVRGINYSSSLFLSHLPSFSFSPSLSFPHHYVFRSSSHVNVWQLLAIAREKREKREERSTEKRRERREKREERSEGI